MTTSDNPLCSIIIISYNTREVTRDCLESLKTANLKCSYEIIMVDNASTDGSVEMFEQDYPEITLIKNAENVFFPKANNQAMKIAKGDYFFMLNSDTLVTSGNVESLIEFLKKRGPKVAMVGPLIRNKDGTVQSEGYAFDTIHHVICRFFFLHKLPLPFFIRKRILPYGYDPGLEGRTRKVGWLMGSALMFRREFYDEYGGLDSDFVFYCEDMEFCYRAWDKGHEVWLDMDSEITHLGGVSWVAAKKSGESKKLPEYHKRRYLFHKKTAGVAYKVKTNQLRLFLYGAVMPFVSLLSSGKRAELEEKLEFHREETRNLLELQAADLKDQAGG